MSNEKIRNNIEIGLKDKTKQIDHTKSAILKKY